MKKTTMVIMCSLLLVMPALILQLVGCGTMKKEPSPNVSAYENAEFKRNEDVFNSKENQEIRAKKLVEEEAIKAAEAKKKAEEAQDKGEGQVKLEF